MNEYIMTLKHAENGVKIDVKEYDGTLEMLRAETGSRTVMLYDASRMLQLMCPVGGDLEDVLVVCDDDGKIFKRPVTLPILNADLRLIDEFVGDLAFIASKPYPYESEDRGLTQEEVEELIEATILFTDVLGDRYPKVIDVHRCYE